MPILFRTALLAAGLTFLAGAVAAEEIRRDFNRSFDVQEGDRLHLEHGDGEVFVEPWDQDRVEIDVVYDAEYNRVGLGRKIDFDVEFRHSGSTVHVVARETGFSGIGFFSHQQREYRFTVKGPAYLLLDLEGEDGDVVIEGWTGEIKVTTEDGDIDLTGIESAETDLQMEDGDLTIDRLSGVLTVVSEDGNVRVSDCTITDSRLRLEDGDVTFTRCEGSARFDLDDGDLVLERFRAATVGIRSEDGDVELDLLPSNEMNVDVRTSDGDIVVDLARGSSASFTVDTSDGPIRLDVPSAVDVSKRERRASGQIGSGEGRLQIRTGDGRVVVRESA